MLDLATNFSLRTWLAVALSGALALFALFGILAEEVVMDGRNWLDRTISMELRQYATSDRTEAVRAVTELGASWFAAIVCGSILLWLVLAATLEHRLRHRRHLSRCQAAGDRAQAHIRAGAAVGGAAFAGCWRL